MTKQERHIYYKALLSIVCEDECTIFGLCYYISRMYFLSDGKFSSFDTHHRVIFQEKFPELWALKPEKHWNVDEDYWFPNTYAGWKKRIALIEKCIKQTA